MISYERSIKNGKFSWPKIKGYNDTYTEPHVGKSIHYSNQISKLICESNRNSVRKALKSNFMDKSVK